MALATDTRVRLRRRPPSMQRTSEETSVTRNTLTGDCGLPSQGASAQQPRTVELSGVGRAVRSRLIRPRRQAVRSHEARTRDTRRARCTTHKQASPHAPVQLARAVFLRERDRTTPVRLDRQRDQSMMRDRSPGRPSSQSANLTSAKTVGNGSFRKGVPFTAECSNPSPCAYAFFTTESAETLHEATVERWDVPAAQSRACQTRHRGHSECIHAEASLAGGSVRGSCRQCCVLGRSRAGEAPRLVVQLPILV